MIVPTGLQISKEHLGKVVTNIAYNSVIKDHYKRWNMEEAQGQSRALNNKMDRLTECNKIWALDVYHQSLVKDFKLTFLCRDKFCNNCKKVKQATRMARFIPHLRPYADNMYHLVLTVPNVPGQDLRNSIKQMLKACRALIRYFRRERHCKGVDLATLGFIGAVRALEVTFRLDDYHPHLHISLALERSIGEKVHRNQFSIDHTGRRTDRLFSDEEILIQKIWKLLYDGERVTQKAIEALPVGYSCTMDRFREADYSEIFKYTTKGTAQDGEILTYEQFRILDHALYNVRQIQGYGKFHNIKDDDSEVHLVDEFYQGLLIALQQKEEPEEVGETPQALAQDEVYRLISRKIIWKYLRTGD